MSNPASRFFGMVMALCIAGAGLAFVMLIMNGAINSPVPQFNLIAGVLGTGIFFALLRGPVGRTIAKMLEPGGVADHRLAARVEEIEDQLARVGTEQLRVAGLEERLEFAERMFAAREQSERAPLRTPV